MTVEAKRLGVKGDGQFTAEIFSSDKEERNFTGNNVGNDDTLFATGRRRQIRERQRQEQVSVIKEELAGNIDSRTGGFGEKSRHVYRYRTMT